MEVSLVSITQPLIKSPTDGLLTAEELVSYCARVSNPNNQLNLDTGAKLLKYCIEHQHWSIFEQVSFSVEIKTSRAIAAQILRHKSFSFQEFSQRYSAVTEFEPVNLRLKAEKNRQSSSAPCEDPELMQDVSTFLEDAKALYDKLLAGGVAKESARMILPLTTKTTLYMHGTLRSWIHYVLLRNKADTQQEHREVALEVEKILGVHFPVTSEALGLCQPSQQTS